MRAALFGLALAFAGTAQAQDDPLAPLEAQDQPPPPVQAVPIAPPPLVAPVPVPPPVVIIPKDWRGVFNAIRAGDWLGAQAGIAILPNSSVAPVAKAELYTARGSPVVGLDRLLALLAEAPDLPEAEQIARMALARGALTAPAIVPRRPVVGLGGAPRRYRARPVAGDSIADQLRVALDPLIKADDAAGAEALLIQNGPYLSIESRAEAAQRVAWAYYSQARDPDARRVADTWRQGSVGEWASQAAWVSALASWRLGDCEAASRTFRQVAGTATQSELGAGGYYWAARAEQACRRPRSVAPLLKAAARSPESFYGLLARETLGMETRLPADPHFYAARVEQLPNVRRAVELVRIGERSLAEQLLRHQARIGSPAEHHGLIEFAKRLDLAGAQFWLAHNGQRGALADARDRYPAPKWAPMTGWRVSPSLAFAHIIQESTFRADAVSQAGAVGLMQVLPGTASDVARLRSLPYSRGSLSDPTMNLEFGQAFIELMRRSPYTGGQLPKVIAAYNAGPLPVGRWAALYDKGDPLLWMESIPYWETRYYVPAVLRNMWVYQGIQGEATPSLTALTQHRWPAFPASRTQIAAQQ